MTTGILGILSRDELAACWRTSWVTSAIHDILISSIAATVAGAITMLAHAAPVDRAIFGSFGGNHQ